MWSLKGSFLAIVLIVACGVASFVTVLTAYRGLKRSRDSYYARYRMADIFAPVKKAPRAAIQALETVPGVRRVAGRIVFDVTLDLARLDQPVSGRIVSVPDRRRRLLCDLHLVAGDWFEGDGTREAIVAKRFAEVHGLGIGDELPVIMNNKKEALRIVGVALSPEFVYLISGANILPDAEHFTVLWLSESFAEAAFDFRDSCNDVLAVLDRGASPEEVIAEFDRRLDRYGAAGAYARKDQLSNRYVNDEIEGLKGSATLVPTVFLGVAAFVLHMLMGRLVRTQRGQIALLRAFGYTRAELIGHYLEMALLVGVAGVVLGSSLGIWFAFGLVGVYRDFYDFPVLDLSVDPVAVAVGCAVGLGFVVLGTLRAVLSVARLTPAEGLRPAAPRVYHEILLERSPLLWSRVGFSGRMVIRHLARTKLRTILAITGVALATGVLMLSFFGIDSTAELMDVQFRLVERQDARITFHNERSDAALFELRRMEGMRRAEAVLGVGVRLRHGHRHRRTGITGLDRDGTLHGLLDGDLRSVSLPRDGLLLSRKLAELLGARVGDELEVSVLTGKKQRFRVPVENVVDEYLGAFAYADRKQLARWIGEDSALNGTLLSIDPRHATDVGRTLKRLPAVSSVDFRKDVVGSFNKTIQETQRIFSMVIILFAGTICFGVVYNTAGISLAERARELASLRVLGFTTAEVRAILTTENLLVSTAGLLPGLALGALFGWLLSRLYDTDLYRFPFVVSPHSVLKTVVAVYGFTLVANWAVGRKLKRLDLVEVLKARE